MSKDSLTKHCALVCELIGSVACAGKRTVLGIAGPPASGKSTLAEYVVSSLNERETNGIPQASLLPMDGYHLDNSVLEPLGLLSRKGAPETFDAAGFCAAIKRVSSANSECYFPGFDRAKDRAVANRISIHPETAIIVVEGNYLLLRQKPWSTLAEYFTATVSIQTSMETLEKRLVQRWLHYGLDEKSAINRARQNDLPNAKLVLRDSRQADLCLYN